MRRVDLHIHSRYSDDGDLEPAQLLRMAEREGFGVIAVTDHNTVAGVEEAIAGGKALGIEVIPGIEIDCQYGELRLHVLGYGIDHRDPRYAELAASVERMERGASGRRLELVRKLGLAVDKARVRELSRTGVITAEIIAEAALADARNDGNPLLAPYRPGGNRADNPFVNFYWDYCAPGRPAEVPMRFIDFDEARLLIETTGGVPVLAHPEILLKGDAHVFAGLVDKGIRGVEAFSSYHSPEACAFWRERADACGVIATCGSDFHGKTKPAIALGKHGGATGETAAYTDLRGLLDKKSRAGEAP